MRLSQMQDIAGCRLIVDDFESQQVIVRRLHRQLAPLGKVKSVDRRRRPSHGYRAVHLIVTVDGKPVEIQVRTLYQHLWAELSESAADRYGSQVKYGGKEIVLLEANALEDLRKTHARYFGKKALGT